MILSRMLIAGACALSTLVAACSTAGGPVASGGSSTVGAPTEQPSSPGPGATDDRSCPPPPEYPTPACTGVPPGTDLVLLPNNVDGAAYRVRNEGEIIDGKHIAGDLVITANNVIVRNSQIDGSVLNDYSGVVYPFSIVDSTVGSTEGCNTAPAVGDGQYSASRILVRNHGDGFRAASDDVTIKDSFVDLCSNPGDHSDGMQTYTDGRNLTFDHNTIDQRDVPDMNSPIFIGDGWAGVSVTNNLVAGGTYSIQVYQLAGTAVVRGNRVVDDTWVYGPVSSQCDAIEWSDNELVRMDENYRVTSVVDDSLKCY